MRLRQNACYYVIPAQAGIQIKPLDTRESGCDVR